MASMPEAHASVEMIRYLPRLRQPIVAVIFIAATFGSARGQNPPEPANPQIKSAIQALAQGRNNEALGLVQRVVKENETNAEAWFYLGIIFSHIGDFDKAQNAFEKAIEIQPDLAAEAHARLGFALVRRNRLPGAGEAARKALSADANNTMALYTLGLVHLRNEAREEALKNADAAIALKPDFAEAYLLKSQASMILYAADRSSNPDETKRKQRQRYREAVTALATYVQLLTDKEEADFWREQLKTLEFYALDESAEIRSVRDGDVTSKAKLISKPEPTYTEEARVDGIQGTVVLRAVFAADGTIKHVLVMRSLPSGLTKACVAAVNKIKFEPATMHGMPVSASMQLEYNFNLY
jgi:TonB family protein